MAINTKWLVSTLAGMLVLLILPFSALAQEETAADAPAEAAPAETAAEAEVQLPDAGTTPDSFAYGLDIAMEKLALALTFDEGKRFEKRLEFAEERLAEARSMALERKFEAMEKARVKYGDLLEGVKKDFVEVKNGDVEAELRKELELERKFRQHREKVKDVEQELKVKVRTEGDLTPEQLEMISSILDSVKGQSGEVEIEIKNEKGKTKVKIELELGEDGDEFEFKLKDEMGITEEERERSLKEMDRVRNNMEGFFEQAGVTATPEHVQEIRRFIEQAQGEFALGNYEAAQELGESIRELMDDRVEEAIKRSLERREDFRQETPRRAVAYRPEDWKDYWEGFERLREEGLSEEKRERIRRDAERFREELEERREERGEDDRERFREEIEGRIEGIPGAVIPTEEERQRLRERFEREIPEEFPDAEEQDDGDEDRDFPDQFSDEERARMEEEFNQGSESGSGVSGGESGSSDGHDEGGSEGGSNGGESSGESGGSDGSSGESGGESGFSDEGGSGSNGG